MYLELKHQGNVMQAGAPLRLHSPLGGRRWTWERGRAGGSLLCSAAWVSSGEKEGGDLING